jgi:hypothetical protein
MKLTSPTATNTPDISAGKDHCQMPAKLQTGLVMSSEVLTWSDLLLLVVNDARDDCAILLPISCCVRVLLHSSGRFSNGVGGGCIFLYVEAYHHQDGRRVQQQPSSSTALAGAELSPPASSFLDVGGLTAAAGAAASFTAVWGRRGAHCAH